MAGLVRLSPPRASLRPPHHAPPHTKHTSNRRSAHDLPSPDGPSPHGPSPHGWPDGWHERPGLIKPCVPVQPPIPAGISANLHDFMTLVLKKDPNQRPTASKLRSHVWLVTPPEPTLPTTDDSRKTLTNVAPLAASSSSAACESAMAAGAPAAIESPAAGIKSSQAKSSQAGIIAPELPDHLLPGHATMNQVSARHLGRSPVVSTTYRE